MEETEIEIENVTPEDLFQKLLQDVSVHEAASEAFVANFNFYGRTLKEHSDALWIDIPDKMTPEQFRAVFTAVGRNIQIASHFYSVASTISNAIAGGGQARKSDIMKAIAESYEQRKRRRPGVELIESMAESYMKDTNNVRIAAKIVKDFWKQKLDALVEVRKSTEQIGISMHSEMKYLEHQT